MQCNGNKSLTEIILWRLQHNSNIEYFSAVPDSHDYLVVGYNQPNKQRNFFLQHLLQIKHLLDIYYLYTVVL